LITVFVAILVTVIWYVRKDDDLKLSFLMLMFWGASIMWFIDAVFEYIELKSEFFTPAAEDMLNDAYLGMSVVALGLIIWLVRLLISDPRQKIKNALMK